MSPNSLLKTVQITCIALILCACSDASPIIVGFSGQLTGKLSDIGVSGRNGAMLAVERINARGGIDGRPIKLISKNDQNTPAGAIQADKALMDAGAIAIIGHMTSSQTMAVMPFINESGMVMVSPTTSTPTLTGKTDSFFRLIVENSLQSKELADYAKAALDVQSVVAVAESDNKNYSFTFTSGFKQAFAKNGGVLLDTLTYSSSEPSNWDALIDKLIEKQPDAVLLTCPAQDAVSIVQRIRSAGLKTKILAGAWAYTEKIIQWGGQFAEGIVFVIDYAADNPNPEFVKFRESYRNRFGTDPNFASAFSYEAMLALAAGLKQTNGSANGLVEAMAPSKIIEGVISPFQLDEFGDVKRNVFIVTVQDGEFRTVEMR